MRRENEQLKRRLSRNSGNSSMPPSSDDQPGKAQPKRRVASGSGRSRGKQPGAPGSALAWSESPDGVEPLYPEACGRCGNDLAGAAEVGVTARQMVEIPLVTAKRIEFSLHKKKCGCGHVTRAARPAAGAP